MYCLLYLNWTNPRQKNILFVENCKKCGKGNNLSKSLIMQSENQQQPVVPLLSQKYHIPPSVDV